MTLRKVKALTNAVILPMNQSPERLIAEFLYNLDDESEVWSSINDNFTKAYCFKNYKIEEIQTDREQAKLWFNSHLEHWGKNAAKVVNPWIAANKKEVEKFSREFAQVYNKFAREFSLDEVTIG